MNVTARLLPRESHAREFIVPSKEWARVQSYIALSLTDLVALSVSFLFANLFYLGDLDSSHGATMLTVIAPIYLLIAALKDAYSGAVLEDVRRGIVRSLQAFLLAAGAILFIAYFLKTGANFSRAVFGLGFAGGLVFLPISRLLLSRPILNLLGGTPYSVVVICDGVNYEPGLLDTVITPEEVGFDPATKDPHRFDSLAKVVANADRVIVACQQDRYGLWASVLKGMAVYGEILTDQSDAMGLLGVAQHGDRRTMVVAVGPLHLRDRLLKRSFDLLVSSLSLILLSPLLLATAVAIRLESRGPALFVQDRIGQDNKIFRIYKFRSMFTDMCDANASVLTSKSDPRVTRVGEFIRRTSIDELPQLLNVLKGDMSIVGPRPHAISAKAADQLYWDVDPRYRHRHSIKPGLTGLAQVRGFRGATDRAEDLTNRLDADLEYVARWSFQRDIMIVLQTLRVLRHDNAF